MQTRRHNWLALFALALVTCTEQAGGPGTQAVAVSGVEPAEATWGAAVAVRLVGEFHPRIEADLDKDEVNASFTFGATLGETALDAVTFVDEHTLTAVVPVSVVPGVYALEVTDPSGNKARLEGAFTLSPAPAPVVAAVSPGQLRADAAAKLLVTGSGFLPGAKVEVGSTPLAVTSQSGTALEVAFAPGAVPPGVYPVSVVNRDGGTGRKDSALTVVGGVSKLRVELLDPSAKTAGKPFDVKLTALDAAGQPMSFFDGTATLADDTGTLDVTATGAFVGGSRTERVKVTRAAAQDTLVARVGVAEGRSPTFEVAAGPANHITATTDAASYGPSSTARIDVKVEDAFGNALLLGDDTFDAATVSGGATVQKNATPPFFSYVAGGAEVTVTTASAPEVAQVEVRYTGSPALAKRVELATVAGKPRSAVASLSSASPEAGQTIVVRARPTDGFGNAVDASAVTDFRFAAAGASLTAVDCSQRASGDLATPCFANPRLNGGAVEVDLVTSTVTGTFVVTATLTTGDCAASPAPASCAAQQTFTSVPGAPQTLKCTADKTTYVVGEIAVITARLEDANGNRIALAPPSGGVPFQAFRQSGGGTLDSPTAGTTAGEPRVSYHTARAPETATVRCEAQPSGGRAIVATVGVTATAGQPRGVTVSASNPNPVAGDVVSVFAQLLDSFGNPVPASAASDVTFAAVPSRGSFDATSKALLADGRVRIDYTTDPAVGQTELTATVAATGNSGSTFLNTVAGPLDHFAVALPSSGFSVRAGDGFQIDLSARDRNGNVVTAFAGAARLCEQAGDSLSKTLSGNFVSGARAETVSVRKVATATTLVAHDGTDCANLGAHQGVSPTFAVTPGDAARFRVAAIASPQHAGQTFGVTVTALDANDNVATAYAGTPALSAVDAANQPLPVAPSAAAAFANGVSTTTVELDKLGTGVKLSAADGALLGTSNAFDVLAGPPKKLGFATAPRGTTINQPSEVVTVEVEDAFGNRTPVGSSLALTVTAYTSLSPATTSTTGRFAGASNPSPCVGGTAPFSATIGSGGASADLFYCDSALGTVTLVATAAGLDPASQQMIVSGAGAAVKLAFVSPPSGLIAGVPATLTVQVQDSGGQPTTTMPAAGVRVTLSTTSSAAGYALATGACPSSAAAYTSQLAFDLAANSQDVCYRDTRATTAGQTTLTAAGQNKDNNANLLSGVHNVSVSGAAVDHFRLALPNPPTGLTAGVPFDLTLTAEDAFQNAATSFTGAVTVAATPADATLTPTTVTFAAADAGSKQVAFTLTRARDLALTADDGAAHTGTSATFTLHANALDHYAIGEVSGTQTAGVAFPVALSAVDAYGNLVESATTVGLTALGVASGKLTPASVSFTGQLTAQLTVTQKVTATKLTLSDGTRSATEQSAFDVTSAGLSTLAITDASPATQTAGVPFDVTVTAKDAYGNTLDSPVVVSLAIAGLTSPAQFRPATATITGSGTVSVTVDKAGTGYAIAATSGGASATQASTFGVDPAGFDHFTVASVASPRAAGSVANVAVSAVDAFGNVVGGTHAASLALGALAASADCASGGDFSPASTGSFTGTTTVALKVCRAGTGYTLAATEGSATGQMVSPFDVTPAGFDHFRLGDTSPATATAGTNLSFTLDALDAFGNATTESHTVALSIPGYTGGASCTSGVDFAPATATFSGTLAATTFKVCRAGTGLKLTATEGSASATQANGFTVDAAGLDHYKVTAPTTAQTAGAAFGVTVRPEDAFGNLVGGSHSVALSISGLTGGAACSATTGFSPDSATGTGALSFNLTVCKAGGPYALGASDGAAGGSSSPFTVGAGGTTHYALSAPGAASLVAGASVGFTVTPLDAFENVTSDVNTVSFAVGDGTTTFSSTGTCDASSNFAPASKAVQGATSVSLTVCRTGSALKVTAADGTNPSATMPSAFDVTGAALDHFAIAPVANGTTDAAFPVSVTPRDRFENATANGAPFAATLDVHDATTSLTGSADCDTSGDFSPASVSIAGATATNVSLKVCRAKDAQRLKLVAGAVATDSNAFDVKGGLVASYAVSGFGPSASYAAGATLPSFTVTALDAHANPTANVPSPNLTVSVGTLTGGSGVSCDATTQFVPGSVALVSGAASVATMKVCRAGTGYTVAVTDGAVVGQQAQPFDVVSAGFDHFTVSTPSNVVATSTFNVTVEAVDAYGNRDTQAAHAVSWTAESVPAGSSTTVAPASTSGINGSATASLQVAKTGAWRLVATEGSSTGTSGTFTVGSGPIDHLEIGAPTTFTVADQRVGRPFALPIRVYDSQNNLLTTPVDLSLREVNGTLANGDLSPSTLTGFTSASTPSVSVTVNNTRLTDDRFEVKHVPTGKTALTAGTPNFDVDPDKFAFVVPSPACFTGDGLSPQNVTLNAVDASGAVVGNYSGNVSLAAQDSNGAVSMTPSSLLVTNGTKTFGVSFSVPLLSGARCVTVTATDTTDGTQSVVGTFKAWVKEKATDACQTCP